jgi:tetratricopeptide (TPR) repeat protein
VDLDSIQRAIALREAGEVEEALREFETLANRSSEPGDMHSLICNQVNCLIRLGRIEEGRARWEQAEALSRTVNTGFLDAWLCFEEGRGEEAIRKFGVVLRCPVADYSPDFDWTQSADHLTHLSAAEWLARLLLDKGRGVEAIPIVEEALKQSEGDQRRSFCFYLGCAYVACERWLDAEDRLRESLSVERRDWWWAQAHYKLGICYTKTGRLELAEEELICSLPADRDDPFWAEVQYRLGVLYFKGGAYIKAKQAFEMSEFFQADGEQKQHISGWLAAVRAKLGEGEPNA